MLIKIPRARQLRHRAAEGNNGAFHEYNKRQELKIVVKISTGSGYKFEILQ